MEKISWWQTDIGEGEKQRLLEAFEEKRFTLGAWTEELERQISLTLGIPYVTVTPSGTAALTMALMAAGIGPGDEVILPGLTWIATAQAVALLGGKVVLADCSERLPLIDPKEVKRKLSKRTRAIIPVHLNGRSCQLEELLQISEESGAVLIEDACKAFASKGPGGYLGTLGAMGCFSLGMVSLISTGYGGAVVTRDGNYDRKLKLIRNHGVPRKGVEQYHTLGFNFRFSDLLAALGIGQLGRLKEKQECVRKVYRRYVEGLSGLEKVQVIGVDVEGGELPLCMEVRSPLRSKIMDYLERHGVEALPFHHPLHSAPYLGSQDSLDHASRFAEEGLILPSGPAQPLENVDRCVELLRKGVALL